MSVALRCVIAAEQTAQMDHTCAQRNGDCAQLITYDSCPFPHDMLKHPL
jgi:hypothetical protein